jgi:hypothetical protein
LGHLFREFIELVVHISSRAAWLVQVQLGAIRPPPITMFWAKSGQIKGSDPIM